MNLEELYKRLGSEYKVSQNETSKQYSVGLYSNNTKLWGFYSRLEINNTLSGLFKEAYGDAIERLLPDNALLVDLKKEK